MKKRGWGGAAFLAGNAWRNFYKTRQWRGIHAFLLDQHLESLSHAFGMNERLELQPSFRAFRLGLAFIVEVGKFVSLPER
jgi:hypothetical protein